jgi:putative heme-binding domain-containing protein
MGIVLGRSNMNRSSRMFLLCLVALACSLSALGQEAIPHRQDKPPNQPYSPEEALRRMTVPEGFAVELVAAEPDLVNPIAMTFDDRGRIWITESLEYPRRQAGVGRDRIKILEDIGGHGRADKVTTFAENLNIPTGIAVGHGGVWVLNAPDLLFMKEKDGKEVSREVVLTGFGRTDTHELPNSLTWGPDGWLYGLNGVFNHCRVVSKGKTFDFTCAMWRVHPRTRDFEVFCEGTSNPWGLAWDPEGSALVSACHWANDHVFHFVETGYYQRQAGPYPPHTMKIGSITDHSHQKTAYCGLCYFDSDAYPERYRGRLYMGNIHGGCINVDVLRRNGSSYHSGGEPDFLTANDAWFMPVSQKVGPDGCLYILDWYDRYHCYQDANRDAQGIDRLRGRLYRVRYQNTPRASRFDLAGESDDQLVRRLASPNIYFREAAQRLLTESNTQAVRSRLGEQVFDGSAPRTARLHGLWALIGTGSLQPEFHGRLLDHTDPAYRAWGVRAAGNFRKVASSIREKVAAMARDGAPDVQLQVAIAARKIEGLDPLLILVDVLTSCGQDKLIPSIAWPNLHPLLEDQSVRFVRLVEKADWKSAPALANLLPHVLERMLSRHSPDAAPVAALVELLAARDVGRARQGLSTVAKKIHELSEPALADLKARLQPALNRILSGKPTDPLYLSAQLVAAQLKVGIGEAGSVRRLFLSADQPPAARLEALEVLIAFNDPSLLNSLAQVLASDSTPFLGQVFAALGHWEEAKVADVLLARYPTMDPELQPLAIDLLLQRLPWTRKLLNAVLGQQLPSGVLNANHLRKIMDGNDREAIWAVEKAWGTVRKERNPEREKVVLTMGEFLRQHPGDPKAGAHVFKKVCAQCHTIYGEGASVGPDLTANGRASFEQLLSNIFDPSLVIGPGYQATTVVTKDGRFLTGVVAEDNDQRIVLKLPGGAQPAIARGNVEYAKVSPLSMMPEGIETLLDRHDLSDLFAFLALDRPPEDPLVRPIAGAPGTEPNRADSESQSSGSSKKGAESATGPLRVLKTNPRYFTDGTGRAIYLAGSHNWHNFQDNGHRLPEGKDPPPAFDFDGYLDFLQKHNHNFCRLWRWEVPKWTDSQPPGVVKYCQPHPWLRSGPGLAKDGKAKFDLARYDPEYFARLRQRVQAAGRKGIYVSIMLFEGWSAQVTDAWEYHPFNGPNNVSQIDAESKASGYFTLRDTAMGKQLLMLQEAYVKKVIDTVTDLDNVLCEVCNEAGSFSTEWQYHIIRVVKKHELEKAKQHPVGMTFQYKGGSNAVLLESPADWISPNPGGDKERYRDNPSSAYRGKVIVNDTDHLWGHTGGDANWVWKCFCRGLNVLFMEELTPSPIWQDSAREGMGQVRRYAEKINLAAMVPEDALAQTTYCLAERGREYLVFQAGDKGEFTLRLTDAPGTFSVEWLNVSNGQTVPAKPVEGGAVRTFTTPFGGPAVLYLKRR